MDVSEKVELTELSSGFTTRRRGEEAYQRLLPKLRHGAVVLRLDGTDVLSASFLDGLLLKLVNDGHHGNVVFVTSNPLTKTKLERLSGTRSVDIRLMNSRGIPRTVRKRASYAVRPRFSAMKRKETSVVTGEGIV